MMSEKRELRKELKWLLTRQIRWSETVDVEKQTTTMSCKDRDIILSDKDKIYDIAEEAINRAIEAEELVERLRHPELRSGMAASLLIRAQEEAERVASLTEENDIQRQAIQNLSAQVAAYRDCLEQIGKGICEANIYGIKMYVNELLASPDPGAEIRERLEKLEKVKECLESMTENAQKVIFDIPYMRDFNCETKWVDELRHDIKIAQEALASLEGGCE